MCLPGVNLFCETTSHQIVLPKGRKASSILCDIMSRMKSKRVVVFGGAFNPPTIAHEAIIAACLELPDFDEVWAMVSGDRIDKHMAASDHDRLSMIALVRDERFANEPRLKISDFELAMPRPTQTYQTVRALAEAFPGTEFWFVFGTDSYISMPSWDEGLELQQSLRIVLLERGQNHQVSDREPNITKHLTIPHEYDNISSSLVRQLVTEGSPLHDVIRQCVEKYIHKKELFSKRE